MMSADRGKADIAVAPSDVRKRTVGSIRTSSLIDSGAGCVPFLTPDLNVVAKVCSERAAGSTRSRMTGIRHHASFMMCADPDTLIELPAISLISARISDRIPMSSP